MGGRMFQLATAGAGFLAGYGWAVSRWAGEVHAASLLKAAVGPGLAVSGLYVGVLACVLWGRAPARPAVTGLRVVVSPAAFTGSFVVAAAGLSGALALVGG